MAERFLFPGEAVEVLFVVPERALGAYRAGDGLVDVGNTHDPGHLFFDHQPPAFAHRHDACAATPVWDYLEALGRPVGHLRPVADAAFTGESARARTRLPGVYEASRRNGLHRALADARAAEGTDAGVYRAVRRWLDRFDRRVQR